MRFSTLATTILAAMADQPANAQIHERAQHLRHLASDLGSFSLPTAASSTEYAMVGGAAAKSGKASAPPAPAAKAGKGDGTDEESKSSKAAKAQIPSNAELAERVETLEKELSELEELTNLHPVDPTCDENDDRIAKLAEGMPAGCTLAPSPELDNDYRVVCTEVGTAQLHLPDMCNATVVLVGGGGAGGNSPELARLFLQLSGGGGGGGIVKRSEAVIGDGYYLVSIGSGGVTNGKAEGGVGGNTKFRLTQRLSLTEATYAGDEIVALGGGRGGGVLLLNIPGQGPGGPDDVDCSYPTVGGSGGGGVPENDGNCVSNAKQDGGLAVGEQGNEGGDGSNFCGGGGGGAGEPGDDATDPDDDLTECNNDKGGDGLYLGDLVGEDYGVPGGWFAGGGNPSASFQNGTLGGGGHRGNSENARDNLEKFGKPNTGGGGMGCAGSGSEDDIEFEFARANVTCVVRPDREDTWGPDGGSGIFFIVFDKCPCEEEGL